MYPINYYPISPKGLKCFSNKVLNHLNVKGSDYNKELRPPKVNQENLGYEVSIVLVEEGSNKTF